MSKQARLRSKANSNLPVFSNRRRAKQRSVNNFSNNHLSVSGMFVTMATLLDREAPPPHAFTRLGCYDLNLLDTGWSLHVPYLLKYKSGLLALETQCQNETSLYSSLAWPTLTGRGGSGQMRIPSSYRTVRIWLSPQICI